MNQQQFERIIKDMTRRYGKMKSGTEEDHAMTLFVMETNLLKTHRAHPDSNSRRAKEAILLALYRVEGYLTGMKAETEPFESEENLRLRDALLMAFDPFTNEEIKAVIQESTVDLEDSASLNGFYKEPVICMLRIWDSVETWEKKMGSNGYFTFLEGHLGAKIPRDEELKYAVLTS